MEKNGHLTIAEPCHEDWQAMSKQEQGRHCDKCCKVVVDFTSMPNEKIVAFISERRAEKICGRFRSEQVRTPENNNRPVKKYRLFATAIYFVFGAFLFGSCTHETHKMGKVKVENSFGNETSNFSVIDSPLTVARAHVDPVRRSRPIKSEVPCTNKVDTIEPEFYKMGEVMYVPIDTTK